MSQFILKNESSSGTTPVSNLFLDLFMPRANGEYVKVYLYLLRALSDPARGLSVAGLADSLECTESDILRALKYWEKQRILKLECDASNTLLGIYVCDVPAKPADRPAAGQAAGGYDGRSGQTGLPAGAPGGGIPERRPYSREDLARFSGQEDCRQLLFVCEQYLGRTLKPSEIETLLYFYDQLRFSADLVEYLVEYCVCKGSRSMHYIETVALAWAEAGISTVAQAKERTTTYTRNTFAIMKAFGIGDRNPASPEVEYIEKWLRAYDFTLDLVLEACRRTMERLHKPNFEYADRILQSWREKKVHTMADVEALDQEHKKNTGRRSAGADNGGGRKASAARPTGFTNFQQRDYDFDEMEKKLLQSQNL